MNYIELHHAVQSAAGLRLRLSLKPMYGPEAIIFPPTYAGGGYLISKRRIPGKAESVPCAILDSVQSQANRMEDALAADIRAGKLHLPHVVTDFSGIANLEKEVRAITSLETPHRIFDAIIRDSELDGVRFPYTDAGKEVVKASIRNATAIFRYDPTSLLFGSWDSTGVSGGLGEKFTRCVVSELVAINCEEQVDKDSNARNRKGIRLDPLNISSHVNCAQIANAENDTIWINRQSKSRQDKDKAAVINHGNILWPKAGETIHGGVTCDSIIQSTTISFPALRQLRFPVNGKAEADPCAHAVLAAIALHAAALNVEKGWHLRSRCDLVLEDGASIEWELLGNPAGKLALDAAATRALLNDAISAAEKAGLPWEKRPLALKPSKSLADLVRKSQQLHRDSTETSD